MYLLKIKGAGKLPDSVQIRDNQFNLISFINLMAVRNGIKKSGLGRYEEDIIRALEKADFNELVHIKEK